jgi:hypothetical protein
MYTLLSYLHLYIYVYKLTNVYTHNFIHMKIYMFKKQEK